MRYGIATWTFLEPGTTLPQLAAHFADAGFDALSFLPRHIIETDRAEVNDVVQLMLDRDIVATVHGACELSREEIDTVISILGNRLKVFSVDPASKSDSRGRFYDGRLIAEVLGHIKQCGRRIDVCFAAEDFPLDALALDTYREELWALLDNPRFGVLIDVGHLNLRRHREAYFRKLTPEQYLARLPLPIVEVHLHDNLGDKDSHGHFGLGNVDFQAVARGLHAVGFDGVSTIEIAPSFHDSTAAQSLPLAAESLRLWRRTWEQTQSP